MIQPLVSVICISYNHEAFVYEALLSLYNQHYTNIQVVIADDCSDDNTLKEIHRFLKDHAQLDWTVLSNDTNQGNCKTFNRALALCHGKYIIDFAADDIFYKNCIGTQVDFFEKLTEEYGVVFCNVDLVDVKGNLRAKHYKVDTDGKAIDKIPVGDVYQDLVSRYFISPVGMMVKKSVLMALGGYDETLAYEDFDFWIRSSRVYKYQYLDECLIAKRDTPHSLSTQFRSKGNDRMFVSTAKVCNKIAWLNNVKEEDEALKKRITYEIRQSIRYRVHEATKIYLDLMKSVKVNGCKRFFYRLLMIVLG